FASARRQCGRSTRRRAPRAGSCCTWAPVAPREREPGRCRRRRADLALGDRPSGIGMDACIRRWELRTPFACLAQDKCSRLVSSNERHIEATRCRLHLFGGEEPASWVRRCSPTRLLPTLEAETKYGQVPVEGL